MNEYLKKIIDTADDYRKFLNQDFAISISDTENYLKIINTEEIVFPMKEGDSIRASGYGEVLDNIAKTKQSFVNIVPKEITGTVTVKSIITPIFDKNVVVG